MHPDEKAHSCPLGVYCYTLPFGFKNVGSTYQRAMDKIFRGLTRKTMECYRDDIVVKSRLNGDHLADLKEIFERMRLHQLKMNPTKSFLEISSEKFLGFVVTLKGIQLDPKKYSRYSRTAAFKEP